MNKHIQHLKKLVRKHLGQTKEEVAERWGKPLDKSDNFIWFFQKHKWLIFKTEMAFIFEEDHVVDIVISQYIFWKEWKNIFYYENQNPEYKIIYLL